ncbi:MAG: glycosyl transferase [Chitinophagales bacterium]|nr:MAG: glycosyl transferase [Chitinophagales bacterium]
MRQPLVSIITVNYNQTKVTCDMLESVKKLTYPAVEVIVVDNGSQENPEQKLKEVLPSTRVIRSEVNLGFAGGNNLGIKIASGEFLFFVNNDTVLTPNIIENLLNPFRQFENMGIVSPKIYYYDTPHTIQYAGYTRINPCTARNRTIGQFERDHGQYEKPHPVPYAHGAAMMVSRKVIEKVGPMPEFFFLYYEEFDWCEQVRKAGFEVYYEPKAKIYHRESVSIGALSPLKTYYLTRNRILFMRRHAGELNFALFTVFLVLFTIPKNLLSYILCGQWRQARAFVKGIIWNIRHHSAETTSQHPANA